MIVRHRPAASRIPALLRHQRPISYKLLPSQRRRRGRHPVQMGGSRTIAALRFLIFLVAALESVRKFQGYPTLTPSIAVVSAMSRRSSRAHKPNPNVSGSFGATPAKTRFGVANFARRFPARDASASSRRRRHCWQVGRAKSALGLPRRRDGRVEAGELVLVGAELLHRHPVVPAGEGAGVIFRSMSNLVQKTKAWLKALRRIHVGRMRRPALRWSFSPRRSIHRVRRRCAKAGVPERRRRAKNGVTDDACKGEPRGRFRRRGSEGPIPLSGEQGPPASGGPPGKAADGRRMPERAVGAVTKRDHRGERRHARFCF